MAARSITMKISLTLTVTIALATALVARAARAEELAGASPPPRIELDRAAWQIDAAAHRRSLDASIARALASAEAPGSGRSKVEVAASLPRPRG
jgi:hypothetical protein